MDDNGNHIKLDKSEKEERILPEKWIGYCSVNWHKHTLTREFVEANFSLGFMEQVKKMGEHQNHNWVYIPPGSDRRHSNKSSFHAQAPGVKYQQKEGEKHASHILLPVHYIILEQNKLLQKYMAWQNKSVIGTIRYLYSSSSVYLCQNL